MSDIRIANGSDRICIRLRKRGEADTMPIPCVWR